jgi:cytochrome c2
LAIRLAFLILALALFSPAVALASGGGCLHCHAAHHQELGGCVDCHGGEERTRRKDLAHHDLLPGSLAHFRLPQSPVTEAGSRLLETFACRRCHISGGKGNRLASNLDHRAALRPLELAASIRRPVDFMPDFHFTDEQIVQLINILLLGSQNSASPGAETPRVVHFEGGREPLENPLVRHCGGCHRLLTSRQGALGRGAVAPNLSGLLTEHYSANFGADKLPWTKERLKTWLENPRRQRPLTQMRSPMVNEEEMAALLEIFSAEIEEQKRN